MSKFICAASSENDISVDAVHFSRCKTRRVRRCFKMSISARKISSSVLLPSALDQLTPPEPNANQPDTCLIITAFTTPHVRGLCCKRLCGLHVVCPVICPRHVLFRPLKAFSFDPVKKMEGRNRFTFKGSFLPRQPQNRDISVMS